MKDLLTYLASLVTYDNIHPLLFTQIHFWVFFLFVFAGFSLIVTKKWKLTARNAYLFAFSLLFYYKTSGLFVLLLVFSTLLGWILGIGMDRPVTQTRRKTLMITGVTINLLVLCYFKYAYFFTDIYNATFGTDLHVVNHLARWANNAFHTSHFDAAVILLPVGISFFTFQNISYIVDVYKHKIPHVSNILDFGFYTSFFPQLVAGPILRADQFVPQLYKPFFLGRRQFGIAIFWILNGLIKKLVLSDYLAVNYVDRIFDNPSLYTPFENFSALMLYSLQVYADFSGYTDIAIGVAMMMGFYLPVNFNSPYKATNPTDFWRRWHMSLSRWLRDYLYIPLGGNRTSGFLSYFILATILAIAAFRLKSTLFTVAVCIIMATILLLWFLRPFHRRTLGTNINNMDTMLLGGMWHGSSFNFITWGGLNGLGILVYKWWHRTGWIGQLLSLGITTMVLHILRLTVGGPLLNMLHVASLISLIVFTILAFVPQGSHHTDRAKHVWSVTLTFVFISFTRLFFRSGSNLDPAEANFEAWQTASMMVGQIGSHWNLAQIPTIVGHYWEPFLVFVIGMIIHWLPERFKRRYRLWFAGMPLWLMATVAIITIIFVYQFVTADLQPFIYFQF
ncbi:MAG: MBOAT family protein [Bacteroidales bacterium]|nr:MBOAT family protein [Bacteroidales bacterium]